MDHLLDARNRTHGDYIEQFRIAQELKDILRTYEWNALSDVHREAIEMICVKLSRIVAGDASHADHWSDVAGYALRAKDFIDRFNDK